MNSDVQQLRKLIAPHDPAGDLRVDPLTLAAVSRTVLDETARTPAPVAVPRRRRRWLIGVPAVTAAVAAALAVAGPGDLGPVHFGPAEARALTFSRNGDFIDVRIVDPNADPQRYRKEFSAHGLNVDLQLRPAPPSVVGTMISADDGSRTGTPTVTQIEGTRDCGIIWCRAGVRIPVGLRHRLTIIFGRPARPGEHYALLGDATAAGEPLHGLGVRNRTVADVRQMARQRHVTIQRYFEDDPWGRPGSQVPRNGAGWNLDDHVLAPDRVPGGWCVHDAFTGRDPGTVELVVAPWPDRFR
ncbi:hypothetical protein GCM10029978_099360 [Actinoallomurus acanthiterrae]